MAYIWQASKAKGAPKRLHDVINDPKCTPGVKHGEPCRRLEQRVIKYEKWLLKDLGFCGIILHLSCS